MEAKEYEPGDLQVWWIPQIPGKSFLVDVKDISEAVKLLDVLAQYDLWQLEHNIKPDYCNAGGLNRYSDDIDGEGTPGWESWYDEESGEDNPENGLRYILN
jgi:hypothetical protein